MPGRFSYLIFILVFASCGHHGSEKVNAENAAKGEKLFNSVGCLLCHTTNGETKYGPPLNDIYNKEVTVIRKGVTMSFNADREYIFRSLKYPDFEKVNGFQSKKMSIVSLNDDQINYLVDYLIYISTNK